MTKAMAGIRQTSGARSRAENRPRAETTGTARSHVPRLVLAGEANSGKTTLVNFLLQAPVLVADIVPNTPCPTLLRFGEASHIRVHRADGAVAIGSLGDLRRLGREHAQFIEVYLPSPVLRGMEILDLPGLLSPADAAEKSQWVKDADVQIWCTPATQAWKASEQAIWLSLARPKASSVLVLTHRDLLSDAQLIDVAERMSRETSRFFAHWTATATPAITARKAHGPIGPQDAWTSTSVEAFIKKLRELLQAVVAQRRGDPAALDPTSLTVGHQRYSSSPHCLCAGPAARSRAS